MFKVQAVHCFRRRCRLPVRPFNAIIENGIAFCSTGCRDEWKKELAEELSRSDGHNVKHIPVIGIHHARA